ncbi:hypothetical protein FHS96_005612 [Sphingomonas zeicaulis]
MIVLRQAAAEMLYLEDRRGAGETRQQDMIELREAAQPIGQAKVMDERVIVAVGEVAIEVEGRFPLAFHAAAVGMEVGALRGSQRVLAVVGPGHVEILYFLFSGRTFDDHRDRLSGDEACAIRAVDG